MPRLNPGDSFPKLTLSTTDGQLTTVPDAFARDFGVVLFYPGAWCPYCSPQPGPSTSRPSSSDTAPSRRPSPPIPAPLSTLIRSTRSPPASDRLIGMVRHGDSTPQILGLISQPSTASCRKTINHVGRGVEDDRVGQQGGELDLVLQLGGVVVADAALVAEPAPGGEVVVGLDLVRRRGGSPAQLRIRQIPKQLDGSGDPPGLAERQVEVCCAGSASTAGSSVTGEIFPAATESTTRIGSSKSRSMRSQSVTLRRGSPNRASMWRRASGLLAAAAGELTWCHRRARWRRLWRPGRRR